MRAGSKHSELTIENEGSCNYGVKILMEIKKGDRR
jgi:hypothetical protein